MPRTTKRRCGSTLNPSTAREDLVASAKLLYELTNNRGPYPPELKRIVPKHADALEARYRTTDAVLHELDSLMGVSN